MTPRPARRPLARALLWTGITAAAGVLLLFIVIGTEWPDLDSAEAQDDALYFEFQIGRAHV